MKKITIPRRRGGPPAEIGAVVGQSSGRLLAWAQLPGGEWAAATTRRLVIHSPAGETPRPTPRSWPWHEVASVSWEPEPGTMVIRVAHGPDVCLAVSDQVRLLTVIRERVTASTVASGRIVVRGSRGVVVAIRRHSDTGELFDQLIADHGVGQLRPEIADQAQIMRRRLSEQAGLSG